MKDRTRRVNFYVLAVFSVSWLAALGLYLVGGDMQGVLGQSFGAAFMLLPGLTGAAIAWRRDGADVLQKLGMRKPRGTTTRITRSPESA